MVKPKKSKKIRKVSDSMGTINVPHDALYGAQTQRAVNNFPISNIAFNKNFLFAIVVIKKSAAIINYKLKLLEKNKCDAIIKASNQILSQNLNDNFPVDIFQTGSGTSTNMNVNEVIANLANKFI